MCVASWTPAPSSCPASLREPGLGAQPAPLLRVRMSLGPPAASSGPGALGVMSALLQTVRLLASGVSSVSGPNRSDLASLLCRPHRQLSEQKLAGDAGVPGGHIRWSSDLPWGLEPSCFRGHPHFRTRKDVVRV